MRTMRLLAAPMRAGFGPSAATWVLLQQVLVRGLVALKFLAVGRMLGPSAIGSVSVALLAVAIAEALSDTGLSQAVVQGNAAPTRSQLGAVWTTLAIRGVLIGLALFAFAPFMAHQFHLDGADGLIQLCAILPLLRGIASPAYFIAQRDRQFQQIAGIEVSAAFVDCGLGLSLAYAGVGAYSVLIGLIGAEILKSALTWMLMTPRPPIRLSCAGIGHYIGFSRWIWAGSIVNLVLNQFDKVVVGKLLGPAQLGAYQVSSRLAQMLLADAALAMSQYLFPTFAARFRHDPPGAIRMFRWYIAGASVGLVFVVLLFRAIAEPMFALILGPAWLSAVPLFRIFLINMAICALIAVLVSYLRAVGDARAVTHAASIQVLVLLCCVPPATHYFGVTGIAWSMTVGLSAAAGWMLYRASRVKPALEADA
ncbi:oligosaccharide flippase family protein [Paraburkholderia sp.]|uniref:oligosaccharide flippase family protein n=1 Tax=Paraburkholderia sp. TaxID=1926495 RepID=UPI002396628D|nr:oligosaccharide flippase family protein [Paraburkholderia sp.]MDE1183022.1 oligosaccharide flippase family protein [Paraburkholderia sp.]